MAKILCRFIEISLGFFAEGFINAKPTLVEMKPWYQLGSLFIEQEWLTSYDLWCHSHDSVASFDYNELTMYDLMTSRNISWAT